MNTAKIYQDALNKGIEKPEEPANTQHEAELQRVQSVHNDWSRHQDTIELVFKLKKRREDLLNTAVTKNKILDNEISIRRCLSMAEAISETLKIISNYGEFDTNRDS